MKYDISIPERIAQIREDDAAAKGYPYPGRNALTGQITWDEDKLTRYPYDAIPHPTDETLAAYPRDDDDAEVASLDTSTGELHGGGMHEGGATQLAPVTRVDELDETWAPSLEVAPGDVDPLDDGGAQPVPVGQEDLEP